jgi:tRNA pseudouridine55 synthase
MGQTVATAPLPTLTAAVIAPALQAFQGYSLQVPPIYSALKQDGESLHRKARRGEAVTVAPRPVTMHQIDLLALTAPDRVTVRVTCSAGTYIRSLAYDLGQALGSCAHLSLLRRERVGAFALEDALTLAEIETIAAADQLTAALLPAGTALGLPEIQLDEEFVARLGHGQKVLLPAASCQSIEPHESAPILAKAMDRTGNFLGVVRCLEWRHDVASYSLWKAEKWLATQ